MKKLIFLLSLIVVPWLAAFTPGDASHTLVCPLNTIICGEALNISPGPSFSGTATLCNEYAAFNGGGFAEPTNGNMSDSSANGTASGSCPVPSSTPHGTGTEISQISFDEPTNSVITTTNQTITVFLGVADRSWVGTAGIWFEGPTRTVAYNQVLNPRTGTTGLTLNLIALGQNGPATLCITAIPVNGMEATVCERYFIQNAPGGAGYVAIPPTPSTSSALNYYADTATGNDASCDGTLDVPLSGSTGGHCRWGGDVMGHFDLTHYTTNSSSLPAYGVLNIVGGSYNMPASAYTTVVASAPFLFRSETTGTPWTLTSVIAQIGSTTGATIPTTMLHMDGIIDLTDHISLASPKGGTTTPNSFWLSNCQMNGDNGSQGASTNFMAGGANGAGAGYPPAALVGNLQFAFTECTANMQNIGQGGGKLWRNFTAQYSEIAAWFQDSRYSNQWFFNAKIIQNGMDYATIATTSGPGGTAFTVASPGIISATSSVTLCITSACSAPQTLACSAGSPCEIIPVIDTPTINPSQWAGNGNPNYSEMCWLSTAQGAAQTAARFTQVRASTGTAAYSNPQAGCDPLQTVAYEPTSSRSGAGCGCFIAVLVTPTGGTNPVAGDQFVAGKSTHPDGPEAGINQRANDGGPWNVLGQNLQIYGGTFDMLTQSCQPCAGFTTANGVATSGTGYSLVAAVASLVTNDFMWITGTVAAQSTQSLQVQQTASTTTGTLAGRYTASPTLFSVNAFNTLGTSSNTYRTSLDGPTYFATAAPGGSSITVNLKATSGVTSIADMSVCIQNATSGCTTTPTRITFNGGATGCNPCSNSGSSTNFQSDYVAFSYPANSTLLFTTQGPSGIFFKSSVTGANDYVCATVAGPTGANAQSQNMSCSPSAVAGQDFGIASVTVVPAPTLDIATAASWRDSKTSQFMCVSCIIANYNLIPATFEFESAMNWTFIQSTIINSSSVVWANCPSNSGCGGGSGNGWGADIHIFDSIWPENSWEIAPVGALGSNTIPGLVADTNAFTFSPTVLNPNFGTNQTVATSIAFLNGTAFDGTANFQIVSGLTSVLAGNPSKGGCPIYPRDSYGNVIPCTGGLVGAGQHI